MVIFNWPNLVLMVSVVEGAACTMGHPWPPDEQCYIYETGRSSGLHKQHERTPQHTTPPRLRNGFRILGRVRCISLRLHVSEMVFVVSCGHGEGLGHGRMSSTTRAKVLNTMYRLGSPSTIQPTVWTHMRRDSMPEPEKTCTLIGQTYRTKLHAT
jgi:hypothetical protein